jgi:hypothetical protein
MGGMCVLTEITSQETQTHAVRRGRAADASVSRT